jgi:uncharacterized protein (DUF2237 family)
MHLGIAMPYDDKNVLGDALAPCSTSPRTGSIATAAATPDPKILGCTSSAYR